MRTVVNQGFMPDLGTKIKNQTPPYINPGVC